MCENSEQAFHQYDVHHIHLSQQVNLAHNMFKEAMHNLYTVTGFYT